MQLGDCVTNEGDWETPVDTCGPEEDATSFMAGFEENVRRCPLAPAVSYQDTNLTYLQVNRCANKLSHHLISSGIGSEVPVAVLLPRSPVLIIAILAILKAGAVYVALDTGHPKERIGTLLRDLNPAAVIAAKDLADLAAGAPFIIDPEPICSSPEGRNWQDVNPSAEREGVSITPESAAYIIYTSGSKGSPKAVIGTHAGLLNRLRWFYNQFPELRKASLLARCSISFIDGSTEILGGLLHGCNVILTSSEESNDPREIADVVYRRKAEMITLTPTLLRELAKPEFCDRLRSCQLWVSSGEVLSGDTKDQFRRAAPGARLVNLYGSSEASGDSCFECHRPGVNLVGGPVFNTDLYVLDEQLEPVPLGEQGEIYIAGIGLARGYLRQPGETAERFVPNPFRRDGSRMYRTGDIGRLKQDGAVVVIGRVDEQVKIRGHRVNLTDIEGIMQRELPLREVLVVADSDQYGELHLNSYVSLVNAGQITGAQLRRSLQDLLPSYMIPARISVMGELPRTITGKLDRRALVCLGEGPASEPAMETPSEAKAMLRMLAEVFGRRDFNRDSSLYDLGMNSLIAMRVASRVRSEFKLECSIADVLNATTVEALTSALRAAGSASRHKIQPR